MIISYKHKFIFWKPYKVGGTSILQALGKYCGEDDIVGGFQYGIHEKESVIKVENYRRNIDLLGLESEAHVNHITPTKLRKFVGEKVWNSFFKFTITRNPWDLIVSRFWFRKDNEIANPMSFEECLLNQSAIDTKRQRSFYFDKDNNPYADFYIRYENLQEDYDKVCKRVGISQHKLPHHRGTFRSEDDLYQVYFKDEKHRTIVEDEWDLEIKYFGYKFD